jgi:hypothetical protein
MVNLDGWVYNVHNVCMPEKSTLTVSIRMTPDMRDRLQAIADEQERTLSWVCMKILRDHLRGLDKPPSPSKKPPKAQKD